MITNVIDFKPTHLRHINTFDGTADHWEGTCPKRTALRGAIRKHYLKEQDNRCPYCYRLRQDTHGYNWDIDHIIPKSTHPHYTYEPRNFAISCKECNITKDNKNVLSPTFTDSRVYPHSEDDFIIIHPHFDNYLSHIKVNYTYDLKIYHTPESPKGIDTFSICGLNRFTEEIAETSEYIPESEVTIGFDDENYRIFYDGFLNFISLYTSSPELQSRLFANFLANTHGLETDQVLTAISTLVSNVHNSPQTDLPTSSFVTSQLPAPREDD